MTNEEAGKEIQRLNSELDNTAADFEAWETERDIACDNEGCGQPAAYIIKVHNVGPNHGFQMRCLPCMQRIMIWNQRTLFMAGQIRCGLCNTVFASLSDFMGADKL